MSVIQKRKFTVESSSEFSNDNWQILPNQDETDEDKESNSDSSEYSGLEDEPDTSDESEREPEEQITEFDVSKGITDAKGLQKAEKVSIKSVDEYEDDSSDEEDIRNTVGNVPMEWYREYGHVGYDLEGRKIIVPKKGDQLDEFLNKMDNPEYWRTVTNKLTGQNVVLSENDVNMIKNMQSGKTPSGSKDTYEPWTDIFSQDVMIHPVTNRPEHKRSFIPSKWEKLKVGQMVHAIRMGWMKIDKTKSEEDEENSDFYMLWKDDDEPEINKRFRMHIPAPKPSLPGHAESYNPPPEFILNEEEEEKWRECEPEDRRMNFLPQKYSSMRLIPSYGRFINERFERCLDLYLCPRQQKMKMNVNPEDLIPKLPKPKDLQPFPTTEAMVYRGHTDMVRCISVDSTGQWLVSGSDDGTIKFWEISVARCMKTLQMSGTVKSVAWNPNQGISLVAATVDTSVYLMNPGLGDRVIITNTDNMLQSFEPSAEAESGKKIPVTWHVSSGSEFVQGFRVQIEHTKEISQVTWHGKGDYFATVVPKGDNLSVLIHQLSKRRSQTPFARSKGLVQKVLFHPIRPFLFVATQRYVRVYNLLKQELSKKLLTNCKWVSSMAVHPGGDNVIVGSYDSRLSWFDMDLSTKPYQTLRHHKKALRQVCYHKRYPLFASASDDCSVIVCHGMVFSDLLQNPQIVPVKVLKTHSQTKGLGVLDCVFHPTQPWIFSSGSDGTVRLYT